MDKKETDEIAPEVEAKKDEAVVKVEEETPVVEPKAEEVVKAEPKKEKLPPEVEVVMNEVEGMEAMDEKIRHVFAFMKGCLSGEEAKLGFFWKARTQCMELFKSPMTQATRAVLWTEYLELVQEARRVKEILDEQSNFAVEQIEIAISGLEESLKDLEGMIAKGESLELPQFADKKCLSDPAGLLAMQKELGVLNSFAARVQTLRKEVIQTGMRLKIKNKFFGRLSSCGDLIFPRRRELIKKVSESFFADVRRFVDDYFKSHTKHSQNYVLRDEIKHFQELAKCLSLNSAIFAKSRKELSFAWDTLKEMDKERKKEMAQKRDSFKQNFDAVMEKIKSLADKCAEEGMEKGVIDQGVKEIHEFMRTVELSRDDVNQLKRALMDVQEPLLAKERADQEAKRKEREAKEAQRKEAVAAIVQEIKEFVDRASGMSCVEMEAEEVRLKELFASSEALSREKKEVEVLLSRLPAMISAKREEEVFQLEGQPEYEEKLRGLLEMKVEQRRLCKEGVEKMRLEAGGSGLDFERALQLRESLESERERLETLDHSIETLQEHLDHLS